LIAELGLPVVELLAPQPGEHILDLGCGDGALGEKFLKLGCRVVGVDASPERIQAARSRGLDARLVDAQQLRFHARFDAVFSRAALHGMRRPDAVIAGVFRALKPGGRFVAECGAAGNVARIETVLCEALARRGIAAEPVNPWYFPTAEEYRAKLTAHGFRVAVMEVLLRPTALPGDLAGWLETFAESLLRPLVATERREVIREVEATLRDEPRGAEATWTADYVRFRFRADKPAAGT
jgi:SAM-dependent methyltransferase